MSKRICTVDDCGRIIRPKDARGLCSKHYARWRREGDDFKRGKLCADRGEGEAYLLAHVGYSGDDCLIWPFGCDSHGYGLCRVNRVLMKASRHMCILVHGSPPFDGAQAAHNCGNGHRGCFAPNHLRWATVTENQADRKIHGTDLRGSDCPTSKLTEEDALQIYRDERPVSVIAKEHRCTTGHVWTIKTGRTWAHVTGHNRSAKKIKKARISPPRVVTDEQVRKIYLDDRAARLIAADYGCSIGLVHKIKSGAARPQATEALRAA